MYHLVQQIRVALDAVDAQLEVDVRACRPAGGTDITNLLTCRNTLTDRNSGLGHMTVDGLVAVVVQDPDEVAVTAAAGTP